MIKYAIFMVISRRKNVGLSFSYRMINFLQFLVAKELVSYNFLFGAELFLYKCEVDLTVV